MTTPRIKETVNLSCRDKKTFPPLLFLIIYTSFSSFFFFPPLSSRDSYIIFSFVIVMYRVWREKKKKINKSVDERNILGWCAAQSSPPSSSEPIFHSTAYRMRARLRNRLISFSSSVAFLHSPPPNCALMRIFPLGFSPKPILRESSDEKFSGEKKKKKNIFEKRFVQVS